MHWDVLHALMLPAECHAARYAQECGQECAQAAARQTVRTERSKTKQGAQNSADDGPLTGRREPCGKSLVVSRAKPSAFAGDFRSEAEEGGFEGLRTPVPAGAGRAASTDPPREPFRRPLALENGPWNQREQTPGRPRAFLSWRARPAAPVKLSPACLLSSSAL